MKMFKSLKLAKEFAESTVTARSKVPLIFEISLDRGTRSILGDFVWIVQDKSLPEHAIRTACRYESRSVGKFTVVRCSFDNMSGTVRNDESIIYLKQSPAHFKMPSILLHKEDSQAYLITGIFSDPKYSCSEVFLTEIAIECKDDTDPDSYVENRIVIGNYDSWICGRLMSTLENSENEVLLSPPPIVSTSTRFENSAYTDLAYRTDALKIRLLDNLEKGNLEFKKSYSIEDKYKSYCLSRDFTDNISASIDMLLSACSEATQNRKDAERILEADPRIRRFSIDTEENSNNVSSVDVITYPLKVRDFETGKMMLSPGFRIITGLSQLACVNIHERRYKDKSKFYPGLVFLDESNRILPKSTILFGNYLDRVVRLHFQGLFAEIVIVVMDLISSCNTIHGTREAVLQSLRTRSR